MMARESKGKVNVLSQFLIVPAILLLIAAAHPQNAAPNARQELVAAKSAMYDSNFRNDRDGLRAAIRRAEAASADHSVRALALYYAA